MYSLNNYSTKDLNLMKKILLMLTILISSFSILLAGVPPNNTPCNAEPLTIEPNCSSSNEYTNVDATDSGVTDPGCGSYNGTDVWFSFEIPVTGEYIIDSKEKGMNDGAMTSYSGPDCSNLTKIECNDDGGDGYMPRLKGTGTAGETIWIRFYGFGSNVGTFIICVTPACDPVFKVAIASDDCPTGDNMKINVNITELGASANTLKISNSFDGTSTDITTTGTYEIGPFNSVDGNGTITVKHTDDATCISNDVIDITCIACNETDKANDFCATSAELTKGGGPFTSSTNKYSIDIPGNFKPEFEGAIDNNSWYHFDATSNTETFEFTVSDCVTGEGLQVQIFDVHINGAGCCQDFTPVSNYWDAYNQGTDHNLGSVIGTDLIIGHTYILAVDGFAGDDCNFSVSGWSATGILPVNLLEAKYNCPNGSLNWTTASELNNDYFTIKVGKHYKNKKLISESEYYINGNGNTNYLSDYEYKFDSYSDNNYIELWQTDFDGTTELLNTLYSSCSNNEELIIVPNPISGGETAKIIGVYNTAIIYDITGKIVNSTIIDNRISGLKPGSYIVVIDRVKRLKLLVH